MALRRGARYFYRFCEGFSLALAVIGERWTERGSCGNQFGNADQIVGDEIEQEVGGDPADAAMLGLAHGAVLLAPTEIHSIIARRDCDMA